jgi:5-methylthioadenosine/S-adenosylhomocysteine deaminase
LSNHQYYSAKYIVENSKTIHKNSVLVINEGFVVDIISLETFSEKKPNNFIKFGDVVISPGFTNAHSHVALNSVKGLGYGNASALYDVMWGIEPALDEEIVYKLSLLGMMDAVSSGTTSINDHYFFAESVARACETIGIRGFIGHTIMTEYGPWTGEEQITLAKSFNNNWLNSKTVHPVVAPHETSTVSPKVLKELNSYARENNLPTHIHLAQTQKEMDFIRTNYNTSPIKHAYNLEILNEHVIAAHCNVVEDGDLELLAESGAFPIFCPTTHGIGGKPMNTNYLSKLNVDWGIGTDCSGGNDDYDMLEEMRTALVLNNSVAQDGFIKPKDIFRKASEVNINRISGGVFSGTLSKNQKADFITISINTPRMQPLHDVINNIVMCASSREVKDVYVEGECIVKDSKFQKIDEEVILEEGMNAVSTLFTKTGFDKKILDGDFS